VAAKPRLMRRWRSKKPNMKWSGWNVGPESLV